MSPVGGRAATRLTGIQKAAVVLMQMDQLHAARVLQQFTESEAEQIVAEIMGLRSVPPETVASTIEEFHQIAVAGRGPARGGRDFAVELLEASFGSDRAATLLNRMANTMAGKAFEFLEASDASQVIALLDGELPQTSALVLAHLRPDRASAVLAGLPEEQRASVALAIATMTQPNPDAIEVVAEQLRLRVGAVGAAKEAPEAVGGVQPLVEIINRTDAATEKTVLDGLEGLDPELAEEVRSRMFTFADIVRLERRDLQSVLQDVDTSVLAKALKNAPPAVAFAVQANISERKKTMLEADTAALGAVWAKDIEEARAEIVRRVRQLEAEGTITVRRGEEDDLVY
ncbi:flagellar motor switch protein FliG [Sinomonas halotolerans]|uniref:Flagellar motor switch protein FliG n=1 Tax=Sinomonas halotolerans TaxID=1644133 RepID=A0ABU9WYS3_9MICC